MSRIFRLSRLNSHLISKKQFLEAPKSLHNGGIRTLLSEAYFCRSSWNSRLLIEPLTSIRMNDFYAELIKKFTHGGTVDPIDIDIFSNNIRKEDELFELEDLINRFRRTPATAQTLPSTPHAVIRTYLQFDKGDALLKVLGNKTNFGIFPDVYCYNLIFDNLIEAKDYKNAMNTAILMMHQENTGDKLSEVFALYSCHKFLQENSPPVYEEPAKEEEVDEDDEDTEWVRVHFLKNNYYDDHFDITDESLLLGKTLWMFGQKFKDTIGYTYQLLGLSMYQKWNKIILLLDEVLLDSSIKLASKEIEKFKRYVDEAKTIEENHVTQINEKIAKLQSANQIVDENMDTLIENILQNRICDENLLKHDQENIYKTWNELRIEKLNVQLNKLLKEGRIMKIAEKKKELKDKEQLLFFFENFHEIQRQVPEKVEKNKVSSKYDDDYVVPEMPHPGFKSERRK